MRISSTEHEVNFDPTCILLSCFPSIFVKCQEYENISCQDVRKKSNAKQFLKKEKNDKVLLSVNFMYTCTS